MNQTAIDHTVSKREVIRVSSSDNRERVNVRLMTSKDAVLIDDATVEITGDEFLDLVCPILHDLGYYSAPMKGAN